MKHQTPKISVIIPAYRAEKYIAEAIESALNQTLKPYEIIVIDDGSPDNLFGAASTYEPEILLFKKNNEGISKTRNFGLQMATGNLIAFLDADDHWPETHIEFLYRKMEEGENTDMVFGFTQEFISPELKKSYKGKSPARIPINVPMPSSSLIRYDVFKTVGYFNESLQAAEFIDWYDRAKSRGITTESIDETVLYRRLHIENNGVINKSSQQDYLKVLRASLARKRNQTSEG